MKDFLLRAFCLAFIFFLSVEFFLILECSAIKLFGEEHTLFIQISAGVVSVSLLTSSILSLWRNCKTFRHKDHKINKIR